MDLCTSAVHRRRVCRDRRRSTDDRDGDDERLCLSVGVMDGMDIRLVFNRLDLLLLHPVSTASDRGAAIRPNQWLRLYQPTQLHYIASPVHQFHLPVGFPVDPSLPAVLPVSPSFVSVPSNLVP